MKLKTFAITLLVCLLLLVATPVFAQPPLPHVFYGSLTIGSKLAPTGTVVEARGTNITTGIQGNPVSTTAVGQYGSASEPRLYVQGSDISNGDIIEFYINGAKANETYQFQSGAITELNLTIASAPPPLPASFVVTNLTVSPVQVEPGETVTIEAEVTNSGGSTGDYTATLKINNATAGSNPPITLDPGESQTVSFSIVEETPDTYIVELAGLQGIFIVIEPTTTPTTASASFSVSELRISPETVEPRETVTIEAEVTNSGGSTGDYTATLKINDAIVDSVSFPLDPGESQTVSFSIAEETPGTYIVELAGLEGEFTVTEAAPSETTAEAINWPVLGGIIAAVVVVGLLIFFWIRSRAAY
jgi:hypothetical protein